MADLSVLNGPPSDPVNVAVTGAVELKAGASRLGERRVILVQPLDGDIYWCYRDEDNSTDAPTTDNSFILREGQMQGLEASDKLAVWAIAASGTVNVRIQEIG